MKRFLLLLFLIFTTVNINAGKKLYYYLVSSDMVSTPDKSSVKPLEFKKGDWFCSPDFIEYFDQHIEIDKNIHSLPPHYSLISSSDYEAIMNGEKQINNLEGFLESVKEHPIAGIPSSTSKKVIKQTQKATSKNTGDITKKNKKNPDNWRMLLYALPLFIPVILMGVFFIIYINDVEKKINAKSLLYPWLTIITFALGAVFCFLYGRFLFESVYPEMKYSTFLLVVIGILLFIGFVSPVIEIRNEMLEAYDVTFKWSHMFATIGITLGAEVALFTTLITILVLLDSLFGGSEANDSVNEVNSSGFVWNFQAIIILIASFIPGMLCGYFFMRNKLKKQNPEAVKIVIPLFVLFLCASIVIPVLIGLVIIYAFMRGASKFDKDSHNRCYDCYYYDGSRCHVGGQNSYPVSKNSDSDCDRFKYGGGDRAEGINDVI